MLISVVQEMMVEAWVVEGLDGGFITSSQGLERAMGISPKQFPILSQFPPQ